jgi:hypothetical protein
MTTQTQFKNHMKTGHDLPKTTHNGTKTINFSRAPRCQTCWPKMTIQVPGALAAFERDELRERTQQGLRGVKAEGKKLGSPETKGTASAQYFKAADMTQAQAAAELDIGTATVKVGDRLAMRRPRPQLGHRHCIK